MPIFNEHFFFEPKKLSKQQAENGRILFKVIWKGMIKNAHIGSFEIDLSQIYIKENHAILHQWVALSNPERKEFNKITGYLKFSVSVTCAGDEQVALTEDMVIDNSAESFVMVPPHI